MEQDQKDQHYTNEAATLHSAMETDADEDQDTRPWLQRRHYSSAAPAVSAPLNASETFAQETAGRRSQAAATLNLSDLSQLFSTMLSQGSSVEPSPDGPDPRTAATALLDMPLHDMASWLAQHNIYTLRQLVSADRSTMTRLLQQSHDARDSAPRPADAAKTPVASSLVRRSSDCEGEASPWAEAASAPAPQPTSGQTEARNHQSNQHRHGSSKTFFLAQLENTESSAPLAAIRPRLSGPLVRASAPPPPILRNPLMSGSIVPTNIRQIGEGQFGRVYHCKTSGTNCVIKMIEVSTPDHAFERTMAAVDEAKHLMMLDHANIVRFIDVFGHQEKPGPSAKNYVCILMEYCDSGTLADHVFDHGLTLEGYVDVCRQLCQALSYIHGHGIVHRDVKLENVFVQRTVAPRDLVKLGDFGLAIRTYMKLPSASSQMLPAGQEATTLRMQNEETGCSPTSAANAAESHDELPGVSEVSREHGQHIHVPLNYKTGEDFGTLCYQPPECFVEDTASAVNLTCKADMWSFGCLLWEAATDDCLPMGGGTSVLGRQAQQASWPATKRRFVQRQAEGLGHKAHRLAQRQQRGPLKFTHSQLTNMAAALQRLPDVLDALWHHDPDRRPSVGDLLQYEWLDRSLCFKISDTVSEQEDHVVSEKAVVSQEEDVAVADVFIHDSSSSADLGMFRVD